jgi:hypothetical protein
VLFEKSTMLLRHRRIGGEKDGRDKKDKKECGKAHEGRATTEERRTLSR